MNGFIIRCNTSNTKIKIMLDFFPIYDIIRLSKGTRNKNRKRLSTMAKLSKQVKDYMWSKVHERMDAVLSPLNEQVKAEEQRISDTLTMAKEKANELFQSILKAEFPEQWKELEERCREDHWTCLPNIATNYTHMIHSPARKKRDNKKNEMETIAREKFNELIMEVELGGIKKDEVMATIAKMELGE